VQPQRRSAAHLDLHGETASVRGVMATRRANAKEI
jgi:hypothetical protein